MAQERRRNAISNLQRAVQNDDFPALVSLFQGESIVIIIININIKKKRED